MTSNNGDGRAHGNRLPSFPAATELGGKAPSPGSAPAGIGDTVQVQPPTVPLPGSSLQPVEASVSGLELPGAFSTAHFLDPAFLAGIANELYAEVEPGLAVNDPEAAGRTGLGNLPAPGDAARQATSFDRFDYADPRLFQGLAASPIPADGKGVQRPSLGEDFYFLSPPAAAAAETPSLQDPLSSVTRASSLNSPAGTSSPIGLPGIGDPTAFLSHGSQGLAVPTPPVPTEVPAAGTSFMPASLPVSPGAIPRDFRKAEAPGVQTVPSELTQMAALNSPGGASPAEGVPGLTEPAPFAPPSSDAFYFLTPSVPAEPLPAPAAGAVPSSQPFSVEAHPQGLSDPASDGSRQAVDLARQRRHDAEAAPGHRRRDRASTSATIPTSTGPPTPWPPVPPTSTKTPATRSAASSGPARSKRSSSSTAPPRPSTSSRRRMAESSSSRGDEIVVSTIEHHANIVPWQQLAQEKGARAAGHSGQRPRRGTARRVRKPAGAAHQAGGHHARLQRPRDRAAGPHDDAAGPPPRRPGPARRQPSRCRTCRWTCRRSTATSSSSPDTSCSHRPASASSTASANCWKRCRPGKAAAT